MEGLEVRWGLVVRVLHALSRLGPWNGDGRMVPLNQHYDQKLFDILPEEDVRWRYAPKIWRGDVISPDKAVELMDQGHDARDMESVDARTSAEMQAAGFHVAVRGSEEAGEEGVKPTCKSVEAKTHQEGGR